MYKPVNNAIKAGPLDLFCSMFWESFILGWPPTTRSEMLELLKWFSSAAPILHHVRWQSETCYMLGTTQTRVTLCHQLHSYNNHFPEVVTFAPAYQLMMRSIKASDWSFRNAVEEHVNNRLWSLTSASKKVESGTGHLKDLTRDWPKKLKPRQQKWVESLRIEMLTEWCHHSILMQFQDGTPCSWKGHSKLCQQCWVQWESFPLQRQWLSSPLSDLHEHSLADAPTQWYLHQLQ